MITDNNIQFISTYRFDDKMHMLFVYEEIYDLKRNIADIA